MSDKKTAQLFLRTCSKVTCLALPEATDFWERLRGRNPASQPWLWLPGCCWVHGLWGGAPLILVQPVLALQVLYITRLQQGSPGKPRPSVCGTLEIGLQLWDIWGNRLCRAWEENEWQLT